jgi:putative iron-only hydrogenase system regulator
LKSVIPVPSGTGIFDIHLPGRVEYEEEWSVETRIAAISIIVENPDSVEKLNNILHDYGKYILGRMGIPYHKRNISIISIVMDAPGDVISALSGKLGMLPEVTAKTVYSKRFSEDESKG